MPIPSQQTYPVFSHQKADLLVHLLQHTEKPTLIFVRQKETLHLLSTRLGKENLPHQSLHGGKKPELRQKAITDFQENKIPTLLSTNSALREAVITTPYQVIYFDFHETPADYQHQLKTSPGPISTFVSQTDKSLLLKLSELAQTNLPETRSPDFPYDREPKIIKAPRSRKKSQVKPLQHKKPKLKNKGPRRKTGRTRKR